MMHSGPDEVPDGGTSPPLSTPKGGPQQAVIDLPEGSLRKGDKQDRGSCLPRRLFASMENPEGMRMKGCWGACMAYFARLDVTWTCTEIRDIKLDKECLEKMKRTFWLSRIVFLRVLSFVYFFAFLSAFNQNQGLIGSEGISPAADVVEETKKAFTDLRGWERVKEFPSLFLLLPPTDFWLSAIPFLGMVTAAGVFIAGAANAIFLLLTWLFYQSLVSVGQEWYNFGWEAQLLETGFLAIWSCPFWSCCRFPLSWPTPKVCVWGSRWLLFRVMLGAGLIKLRQDTFWRDLTALDYHFETQPVPTPLAWYFHQHAPWVHVAEAVICLVMNCMVPILVLIPRRTCRIIGGALLIAFQLISVLCGNASFSNFLTIVPAVMCLDDYCLKCLFPGKTLERMSQATRGCAGEWSCPQHQGWPLDHLKERKEISEKHSESQSLLGEKEREEGTLPLSNNVKEQRRSCCCWYWPDFVAFIKRHQMAKGTVDAGCRHIQNRWWKILSEVAIAAAIIACALRLSKPVTYAVWEVISLFFLVLLQAAFSAFVSRTKASYIFTEVVLSIAVFVGFSNLFAYGPEVWSVWLTSCLLTVLVIFSYSTLRNAALVTKVHIELLLFTLITVLSISVVQNLLSPDQLSNSSFEPFHIVNTYGTVGTVQKERYELVIQGTNETELDNNTKWHDYEFQCKPTNLWRRPCFAPAYQHRLDWLIASVSTEKPSALEHHKWFPGFLYQLLKNNSSVTKLLHLNPFEGKDPPTYIRVLKTQYRFTSSNDYDPLGHGPWWQIQRGTTEVFMHPREVPGSRSHVKKIMKERRKRQIEQEAKKRAAEEARRRMEEEQELKRRLELARRAAEELQKRQEEAAQRAEALRKQKKAEQEKKKAEQEAAAARKRKEREAALKRAEEEAAAAKKRKEEEAAAARKRKEEEEAALKKAKEEAALKKAKEEAKAREEAERKKKEYLHKKAEKERELREKAEREKLEAEQERRRQVEKQQQRAQEKQKALEAQQQHEKQRHDLEAQAAAKRQEEEGQQEEKKKREREEAELKAKKQKEEEAEKRKRLEILAQRVKHKLGGVPLRNAARISRRAFHKGVFAVKNPQ